MSWFDEQIRQRKEADLAAFEESFQEISGAIMGQRMSQALNDDRRVTTDAIGDILKYYHVKPKEVPDSIKDTNEVLEYLMRPFGIMRRNVRLEKGWQKDAIGAMLGTRKDNGNVVALIPGGLGGYSFYDYEAGKRVKVNRRNAELFDTEALAFYKPFPLKKMNVALLGKYMTQQLDPGDLVMLAVAMVLVTAAGMLMPVLNNVLFSGVLGSGSINALVGIGIYMVCAGITVLILSAIKQMITGRIDTKLSIYVEAASMSRLLSLPPEFFKQFNSGELSTRITYINSLAGQLISVVLSTGLTSLFSLAYIFEIFYFTPALVAPALIVTVITVVISIVTMLIQARVSKEIMLLTAKERGISHGLVTGVQKIRLSGAEERAFAIWGHMYAQSAGLQYNPPMMIKLSRVISTAVSLLGTLVLYFAAIQSGESVADYYAFNAAYATLSGAFMSLVGIASTIASIKPTLDVIKPIFDAVPEIDEKKTMVTKLSGGVELINVTFRYREDMPLILDDISLKIRPGQYVAVVGKTGCGKSTLVRLLLGFEKPLKGSIYYDGKDIKNLDPKSLRRRMGSVLQDGKLFNGDIYSNIVISAPWLTVDDAWEAAEIAGMADDIRDMPMGMHTIISEGEGGISGGQKQRLMIARAVAPKPKILIFDEATSALDNITQKHVSEALDKMNCTRIVIAHRLSTIMQCDRIVVLDEGHIVEDGTYDELIKKGGFFADLVERQRLDVSK